MMITTHLSQDYRLPHEGCYIIEDKIQVFVKAKVIQLKPEQKVLANMVKSKLVL